MTDVVLRAESLSKKYLIGHETKREQYTALRDVIGRTAKDLARSASDMFRGRQLVVGDEIEEHWALKDVNFEIKRGEVVGIIGRNGAGKSTLLKILSRITEPTEGRVTIKGRVASLLEVGTGFHPELTGRENIFLNGAILGMTRAEIRRKFDEIVDFADIEKFLDTPVKRYSSGMYVRLAFAVAAHLEPEILIVDEVLAVGDAEFQKKCLGKMRDVAGHGRTVLFVSHNMGAVQELCSTSMLLAHGEITCVGSPTEAMAAYASSQNPRVGEQKQLAVGNIVIKGISLIDRATDKESKVFRKDSEIEIAIFVQVQEDDALLHIGYALHADHHRPIWWSFFGDHSGHMGLRSGCYKLTTALPKYLLNDGRYTVELMAARHNQCWLIEPSHREIYKDFTVEGGAYGNSMLSGTTRPGLLMPVMPWRIEHAHSLHV